MQYAIEADALVKRYGEVTALDQVSLAVEKGEIFGFLGPNGAGKSTFVKILLNLVPAGSGTAKIFGLPVNNVASRRKVGFLPENIRAYHFLTVYEFLSFHAELAEIEAGRIKNEVERCIDLLGLLEKRKKRLGSLSKGMMQRVGIAQAILGEPQLLFLDEPTSGLDPVGIRELRSLLLTMKDRGTTIFLNSHLLSEVERTCDRLAILNKGKIIKIGSKSDLAARGRHLKVEVNGYSDSMASEINKLCNRPLERDGNLLRIYPEKEKDSVIIHKILLDQGAELSSLAWKGESLEELFYRLVKDENLDNC